MRLGIASQPRHRPTNTRPNVTAEPWSRNVDDTQPRWLGNSMIPATLGKAVQNVGKHAFLLNGLGGSRMVSDRDDTPLARFRNFTIASESLARGGTSRFQGPHMNKIAHAGPAGRRATRGRRRRAAWNMERPARIGTQSSIRGPQTRTPTARRLRWRSLTPSVRLAAISTHPHEGLKFCI